MYARVVLPMHGVILSTACQRLSSPLHPASFSVQSCILLMMYPICRIVLEAVPANIRVMHGVIRVLNGKFCA